VQHQLAWSDSITNHTIICYQLVLELTPVQVYELAHQVPVSSSISSLGSSNEVFLQSALLLPPSDFEEIYAFIVQAKIDKLHHKIITSRVLYHNPAIKKVSQLPLLNHWHNGNLNQYRRRVCINPNTFKGIIKKICTYEIFHNNSNVPQAPVEVQLAIFLF
jgi:hypothetical protein